MSEACIVTTVEGNILKESADAMLVSHGEDFKLSGRKSKGVQRFLTESYSPS
jgi:hypothetical protein